MAGNRQASAAHIRPLRLPRIRMELPSYDVCHQLTAVNGQTAEIEFAQQNAVLAAEFMRQL
jgi:hypothetical protein